MRSCLKNKKDILKRCPMCGGRAFIAISGLYFSVICENCELESAGRQSEKEAVAMWNRRAYELLYEQIKEYQLRGYSRAECLTALAKGRE